MCIRIGIEILSFLWLLLMLDYAGNLTLEAIIKWYACYQLMRAVLYVWLYRKDLKQFHFSVDRHFFYITGAFFLLSLSGFLQSRAVFCCDRIV